MELKTFFKEGSKGNTTNTYEEDEHNKEPSDISTFIMPTNGHLNIWTWAGFSKVIGKMSCNTSSDILLIK